MAGEIKDVKIEEIEAGEYEQRLENRDEDVRSLAASIVRVGVLNPLLVSDDGDGLRLIAGHRRLLAAKLAGLKNVPCIIRKSKEDMDQEICFAENFFRKDLSPVELACALRDTLKRKIQTVEELAAGFHKSHEWVHRMVAIAGWPADVQEGIHNGGLSVSAANNLAVVTDSTYRDFLVRNAVEQGATARTTASWLQAWRAMQPASEAITSEPVGPARVVQPLIPQAPCLCCSEIFPVDRMSHVPLCGECVKILRSLGINQGGQ